MKIHVTRDVTVKCGETATVHYEAGYKGIVPSDHIERIEKAGSGQRLADDGGAPVEEPDVAHE